MADKLIPNMLFDPAPDFRRDAIERLIVAAEQSLADGDRRAARKTLETALSAAVHDDHQRETRPNYYP